MENNNNMHQFAERYLKFNEYGLPEYCYDFDAKTRTFTRMRQLTNRELTSVELPVWEVPYAPVPRTAHHESMLINQQAHQDRLANQPRLAPLTTGLEDTLADYAQGGVTIAAGCFKDYDRLQVVVPADYSVRFNNGCFDANAEIELLTPADTELKAVDHSRNGGFYVDRDSWTLLAHRDFNFQGLCGKDGYHLLDAVHLPYQVTVSHPKARQKLSTCLLNTHQAVHEKVAGDLSALANRWVRWHGDLHANLQDLRANLHEDLQALHQNIHGNLQDLHQNLHARFDATREK